MSALAQSAVVTAGSWALLHSLWQATVAALVLRIMLVLLPARKARVRHGLAAAMLAASVLAPLITAIVLARAAAGAEAFTLAAGPADSAGGLTGAVAAVTAVALPDRAAHLLLTALPFLLLVWAVASGTALVRVAGGVARARRSASAGAEAPPAAHALLTRLAREQGIQRPVRLVVSAASVSPAAIGLGRATIVLPPQALAGLSSAELQAVLLHELAHIRRRDDIAALLQAVADALLVGNPAARWISHQLRSEREHCCDDDVVARTGSLRYARALVRLDDLRLARVPHALAADGTPLVHRIRRLAAPPPRRPGVALAAATACALALVLGAGLFASTLRALPARGAHMTIRAQDPAGPFTISLMGHRVVGATIDGRPLPPTRLQLNGDSLHFLTPVGNRAFSVRLLRAGGITWLGRRPAR